MAAKASVPDQTMKPKRICELTQEETAVLRMRDALGVPLGIEIRLANHKVWHVPVAPLEHVLHFVGADWRIRIKP